MGWRGIMGGSGRQRNMPRCMRKWRGEGHEEMVLAFTCRSRASRILANPCGKKEAPVEGANCVHESYPEETYPASCVCVPGFVGAGLLRAKPRADSGKASYHTFAAANRTGQCRSE